MTDLRTFDGVIAEIAARLDLREPNAQAVQTISAAVSQYYDVEAGQPPFEAVIDSATGVGKTYIMLGAMELLWAAHGVRDFVVIAPGRTILQKTQDNFTAGHPKSLLGPMSFRPTVITADNFATPAVRAAMDDPSQVKIYAFTVQSLIRPDTKAARRTHRFQEGLGSELYRHLQQVPDLVVFADEHHAYYGPAFSDAVRELRPWVLLGLTATPAKKTPEEQIIFRYPLAAAIADRLVKTPVIVGRKDDRTDAVTKLNDGVTLLEAKAEAIRAYAHATGKPEVAPVMLVVAKSIDEADEYGQILRSQEFQSGRYQDSVLVVHSNAPDEALAALAEVEEPRSHIRIIISVGMLKEGWDVKNVYVIASMRASVSEILTEQTLGRGMRLPYGTYTGIEIIDTLEVIAHERYEDLLKKAGVLNQAFVDYRTWAALRTNAKGQTVVVTERVETSISLLPKVGEPRVEPGTPVVTSMMERQATVAERSLKLKRPIVPRSDAPKLQVPILRMSAVTNAFSLADITDHDSFRKLGVALATSPEAELARTLVGARVVVGADGIKRTELVRSTAADKIRSALPLFTVAELRDQLLEVVITAPSVAARPNEAQAARPIVEAFLAGLGERAAEVLSANFARAAARLVQAVGAEQKRFGGKPRYDEVVELRGIALSRATDRDEAADRFGPFSRSLAYGGWKRSVFPLAWFDSEPERRLANTVDDEPGVSWWLRLHVGDIPILWNSGGQEYNPDLLVIEQDGTHWIVEVKMAKEMASEDVLAKREAAKRWANYVNADPLVTATWQYLLVSETDVVGAKGSWPALKGLGQ